MADGFTFLAVSADAFVVELDVHIQARSDGEEVSSFQFKVFICAAECDFRLGQGRFLNLVVEGLGERVELQILLWRWFFDFPIFEPQAGDAFEFMGVVGDERQIKCKSLAADL
jgi:hypothetical protein